MKIIIILLLMSLAFGQGTIGTDSKCGTIIDGIFYEEDCFEPTRERVITFGDILDYAEECYNDKKEIDEDNWCLSTFPGYSVYNEMWGIVYLHRTPTFSGFIEWYERSIK